VVELLEWEMARSRQEGRERLSRNEEMRERDRKRGSKMENL